MKKKLKKNSSQCLFQANLLRSLKTISLRAERRTSSQSSSSRQSIQKTLGKISSGSTSSLKTCENPKMTLKKSSNFSKNSLKISNSNTVLNTTDTKLIKSQIECKFKDILYKSNILKDKQKFLKEFESQVAVKNNEIQEKQIEINIQKMCLDKIVAGIIVSGIIDDLIWDSVFLSLKRQRISLNTRKQACLSTLDKIKKPFEQLNNIKVCLGKNLCNARRTPIPNFKN
jgi:PAB1-binding protein PBP1